MRSGRGTRAGVSRSAAFVAGLVLLVAAAGCTTISVRLAMNEGVNHFKSKNYEKAVECFKRAISIDSKYDEAYLDLGLTYMELYEPGSEVAKDLEYADGAITAFKSYIELRPDAVKAKDYLINVCSQSKRMQDAIDFFLRDYEKNPNDLKLVQAIAGLYQKAGNADKAIEWFEKMAQLDPTNPEAHYSVGVACWGRSYNSLGLDYETRIALIDKGLASLEKAASMRKDYFEALSYISLLYREKAKYDISPAATVMWRQRAEENLTKAMEIRNAQLAAQAQAAAKAAGTSPTAPAKTEGQ